MAPQANKNQVQSYKCLWTPLDTERWEALPDHWEKRPVGDLDLSISLDVERNVQEEKSGNQLETHTVLPEVQQLAENQ